MKYEYSPCCESNLDYLQPHRFYFKSRIKNDFYLAIINWCEKNCNHKFYSMRVGTAFYFENKKDAMLFKLVWFDNEI